MQNKKEGLIVLCREKDCLDGSVRSYVVFDDYVTANRLAMLTLKTGGRTENEYYVMDKKTYSESREKVHKMLEGGDLTSTQLRRFIRGIVKL